MRSFSRNTRLRKPSHLGSNCQPASCGMEATDFASIVCVVRGTDSLLDIHLAALHHELHCADGVDLPGGVASNGDDVCEQAWRQGAKLVANMERAGVSG